MSYFYTLNNRSGNGCTSRYIMQTFEDLNISKQLLSTLKELGLNTPTPVQSDSFALIKSGKNVVGISQTGTGKTLAYLLPLIQEMKFSNQLPPRALILVPTRELVVQVVEAAQPLCKGLSLRVQGVYGGVNLNKQALALQDGVDLLVATPGRLYDLTLNGALRLKEIKSLVIDEVDIMLDLGFRFQLTNIFDLLPEKRQNIMFSATMTEEIDALIDDYFIDSERISIAVSGTPLQNIEQQCYSVPNFHTKVNLLSYLLSEEEFKKVLVFAESKKMADRLFETLKLRNVSKMGIIHSNKSQNARLNAVTDFDEGKNSLLIATDVMARGLDMHEISHVINFDTPLYPENYMHRIGRTGRAKKLGVSILFSTEREQDSKVAIELLMDKEIEELQLPEEVAISHQLIPEERVSPGKSKNHNRNKKTGARGEAFHEKKDKNKKVNMGGSYHREIERKYSKPKTRGDKKLNRKKN
jgi:ATP-dependent RNA helicase RhlE